MISQEPSAQPALPKAELQFCGALQGPPEDQQGNIPFTTPDQVLDLTHFSHVSILRPVDPGPLAEAFPRKTHLPPLDINGMDPCLCRQVPTGLPTSWGPVSVPDGL